MSNVVSSGARAAPASTPRKAAILDATLGTLSKNLPAILAGLGLVVLWQVVIWIFKIPTFMAPSPADVV
ncbi:ABC transporter permease, partial [Rhizobium ruizarguesonis]